MANTRKKVFITGGSRGIGLAIARQFHQHGYHVIIGGRNQARLEAAAAELPGLETYACDLAEAAEVDQLIAWLHQTHAPLDVLVNNAGIFRPGSLLEESGEALQAMMRVNFESVFQLTQGLLPAMVARKQGSIINIGSIAGKKAYASSSAYSISKFALQGYTENLRQELMPHGIRVLNVLPGATWTDSWAGADLPEDRLMPAEDIGRIVYEAYALSERTVIEEVVARPQLGDL